MKKYNRLISAILTIAVMINMIQPVFAATDDGKISMDELMQRYHANDPNNQQVMAIGDEYNQDIIDEINNNPICMDSDSVTLLSETESNEESSEGNTEQSSEVTDETTADSEESSTLLGTESEESVDSMFAVETVNAPFNEHNNKNESVSLATGAMSYEKTLLSLPGRNGLDLNLTVKYNSDDSFINRNKYDNRIVTEKVYSNFAIGWAYNFVSIVSERNGWSDYLRFPDGSEYQMEYKGSNDGVSYYKLKNYLLNDISLTYNSEAGGYVLEYLDGTKEIISGGNIIRKEDKFGNSINFEYEVVEYFDYTFDDYVYSPDIIETTYSRLSKITDSCGRVVNINYFGTPVEPERIDINVDGQTISSMSLETKKSLYGNVVVLSQITDSEGLKTSFKYEEKVSYLYSFDEVYGDEYNYEIIGEYFVLSTIVYPTGGNCKYSYLKARYNTRFGTSKGWYAVYKIAKRQDSSGNTNVYYYNNNRSGYPTSYIDTYTGYIEKSGFEYQTIVQNNNSIMVHTFDQKHNIISEQQFDNTNSINTYISGYNDSSKKIVMNNNLYGLGISDNDLLYLYEHDNFSDTDKDVTIKNTWHESIDLKRVKTYDNKIYYLNRSCDRDEKSRTYYVKYTDGEQWYEGSSLYIPLATNSDSDLYSLSITNNKIMYYHNGMFYTYVQSADTIEHIMYNIDTDEWDYLYINEYFGSEDKVVHLFANNGKIYYWLNGYIYECDLNSGIITKEYFYDLRNSDILGGFVLNNNTFVFDNENVYLFNYQNETIKTYSISQDVYGVFQKGSDGNLYSFSITASDNGLYGVYKFNPYSENTWEPVAWRLSNITEFSVIMGHNVAYIVPTYNTENVYEKIELNKTSNARIRTDYTYNSFMQPVSQSNFIIKDGSVKCLNNKYTAYKQNKSLITSTTDALGNVTKYDYTDSAYGIPVTIKEYADTENEVVTTNELSEDKTKILNSITVYDDRSIKTIYVYDAIYPGNVVSETVVEIKDGIETILSEKEFIYDNVGLHIIQEKQKNVLTNNGSFELQTIPEITISYTYDHMGHLTSQTDAMGNVTSYTYNNNGWLLKTTYPDGTFVENTYSLSNGTNKITTSYNDIYSTVDYFDELGRQSKHCIIKSGSEIMQQQYGYANGNLAVVKDGLGNSKSYYYDAFDRITTVWEYENDSYLMENTIEYDDYNLTEKVFTTGGAKTIYYDNVGRVIANEQNTDAGVNKTQYAYNSRNELVSTTNAMGNSVVNEYNDLGQLLSVTNEIGQKTYYEYDKYGNVLSVTYPGGNYANYTYDNVGRVIKAEDALGNVQQYTYDKNGNPVAYKDKNGVLTTSSYDNMNRLTNTNSGSINIGYTYNEFGNVLTMKDTTGTTTYEYNDFQNLVGITAPDGETISYSYDIMNNVVGMTDYANNEYRYVYDGMYRLNEIYVNNKISVEYEYNNMGVIKSAVYPKYAETYSYDSACRLTEKVIYNTKVYTARSTAENVSYEYTYDVLGNQTQESAVHITMSDNDLAYIYRTNNYTYDDLGRMTSVQKEDGTTTSYTFDAGNNIMTKSITHPSRYEYSFTQDSTEHTIKNISTHNYTYSYDKANRLITSTESIAGTGDTYSGYLEIVNNFTYDNNGNTLSKTIGGQVDERVVQYGYNELNQLVSYTDANGSITNYGYDGTGMRVSKTQGDTTHKFYWDRGYIVNQATDGAITMSNHIGIDGIYGITFDGTTEYLFKNGHGDVVGTFGNRWHSFAYDYNEYGTRNASNEFGIKNDIEQINSFRYCGEYYDDESGLIYLRNRYYDPSMGRFITEDPIKDGNNWYAYCGNNPINFVDPWGLSSFIFVSSNMSDQADDRKTYYTEKYGTDSYKIVVSSAEEFVTKWNNLFEMMKENNYTVDAIEIISHGSIDGAIGTAKDGTAYSTGYIYFTDEQTNKLYARNISDMANGDKSVEDLIGITAKELNISSCNGANKDTYNIVYGFMQKVDAQKYSGFDGGAQWNPEIGDHIRGGGEVVADGIWGKVDPYHYVKMYQHTWWKYVEKSNGVPIRTRLGRRYFN